ncbi:DUF983 domain-containing protein [Pedobacter frigiditerrae]|uniref:DUF983 domain-containing protein n=1 Tax=Pedobacter frigiditerrae TaxID=2530452 RepID=A0A4R0MTM1_9SPHI|nr:DUF983 domain-containing protein [Pedobacter frigiditerrae]TCC89284.1 DUF983 domain-containing protein [Pedobacter frigiditerrae]
METNKENKGLYISQWSGIVNAKCPRCRVGQVFSGPTYGLKIQKMNENCPHCNLKFEREPGYFYVAMFVSYAMNVAEMITVSVAAYILGLKLDYDNLWYFVILLFGTTLVFSPFNYRYSRIALLYWLSPGLHYEPERSK